MNAEFETLIHEDKLLVLEAIDKARQTDGPWRIPTAAGEVYAYPHPGGGIAWGINGAPYGFCIARGIYKPAISN